MVQISAGERVVVRDEEWLVRAVRATEFDGTRVEVTGVSELVRDQPAVFFDHPELDSIEEPVKFSVYVGRSEVGVDAVRVGGGELG